MKIYAEWILYGKFYNEFFNCWEDYFRATFNPDCEIKVVKEIRDKSKRKRNKNWKKYDSK